MTNLNKPRFEIKSLKCVSTWSFNLKKNKFCTICRQSLNRNSLNNQEKGIDSIVEEGICGHCFHSECILPWNKKNNKCPVCFAKWEPKINNALSNVNSDSSLNDSDE